MLLFRLLALTFLTISLLSAADAVEDNGEDPAVQELNLKKTYDASNVLWKKGDWAAAAKLNRQVIETALDPTALANSMGVVIWSHYLLACNLALLKDSEAALLAFEKAVAYGFDDVAHVYDDSDMDSLRALPRFQDLIELALDRSAEHTEVGTLFLPTSEPVHVIVPVEDLHRLALLIPATEQIRERVVALDCTQKQRQELITLMNAKKTVQITGTGGTLKSLTANHTPRFKVVSFSVAPAAPTGK